MAEIKKLSRRAITLRLQCSRYLVARALELDQPPVRRGLRRISILDPYKAKIGALLAQNPELSAKRIREEIARGPDGYTGSAIVVRRYLRTVRPTRRRVYQEVHYEPAQAMQVDWGEYDRVRIGTTMRKVSVFVAVLCYSRLTYIEFTLSQRKAEFYRSLVNAVEFFGGSPRALIIDNLKAAVINGSGRTACFHPEFLALCGYYCLQPIACERRDSESKGIIDGGVRYVKHNALSTALRNTCCVSFFDREGSAWASDGARTGSVLTRLCKRWSNKFRGGQYLVTQKTLSSVYEVSNQI